MVASYQDREYRLKKFYGKNKEFSLGMGWVSGSFEVFRYEYLVKVIGYMGLELRRKFWAGDID